jgi:hypothetical protein
MRMVRRLAGLALAVTLPLAATPAFAQQATTALNFRSQALALEAPATTTFSFEQQTMRGFNVAQQPVAYNDEGIGFGILAGISRSTIKLDDQFDDLTDVDSKGGWLLGIWFGGNRNGTLGFMGEISYAKKGANEGGGGDGEIDQTYLEITAPIRINLGQTDNKWGLLVYPMVGPYVDILLKAEDEAGVDIEEAFNGFDAGILFGAGVEILRFGFEVRYTMGLKSISADEDGEGFDELTDSKSRSWQFVAKFRLN